MGEDGKACGGAVRDFLDRRTAVWPFGLSCSQHSHRHHRRSQRHHLPIVHRSSSVQIPAHQHHRLHHRGHQKPDDSLQSQPPPFTTCAAYSSDSFDAKKSNLRAYSSIDNLPSSDGQRVLRAMTGVVRRHVGEEEGARIKPSHSCIARYGKSFESECEMQMDGEDQKKSNKANVDAQAFRGLPPCRRDIVSPPRRHFSRPMVINMGAPFYKLTDLKVAEVLACGGSGIMLLAGTESSREIAVKAYLANYRQDNGKHSASEFHNEYSLLSCCRHPGIVSLLGWGCSGGQYALILEHLSGGSLREAIDIGKERPSHTQLHNQLSWSVQAAEALSFLHSKNVLHRDVKPEHFLFRTKSRDPGEMVLVDFSFAQRMHSHRVLSEDRLPIQRKTDTDAAPFIRFMGTTGYLPPEAFSCCNNSNCRANCRERCIAHVAFLPGSHPRSQSLDGNSTAARTVEREVDEEPTRRTKSGGLTRCCQKYVNLTAAADDSPVTFETNVNECPSVVDLIPCPMPAICRQRGKTAGRFCSAWEDEMKDIFVGFDEKQRNTSHEGEEQEAPDEGLFRSKTVREDPWDVTRIDVESKPQEISETCFCLQCQCQKGKNDVWQLGCLLREIFGGQEYKPFFGMSHAEVATQFFIKKEAPEVPADLLDSSFNDVQSYLDYKFVRERNARAAGQKRQEFASSAFKRMATSPLSFPGESRADLYRTVTEDATVRLAPFSSTESHGTSTAATVVRGTDLDRRISDGWQHSLHPTASPHAPLSATTFNFPPAFPRSPTDAINLPFGYCSLPAGAARKRWAELSMTIKPLILSTIFRCLHLDPVKRPTAAEVSRVLRKSFSEIEDFYTQFIFEDDSSSHYTTGPLTKSTSAK